MCDLCYQKSQSNQITAVEKKTPVVDLPLEQPKIGGRIAERERAIKEGIKALEPGILQPLIAASSTLTRLIFWTINVADVLLDAAAMGVNIVEREGVSVAHPSKFILVGTMNPEEGEIRPSFWTDSAYR